METMRPGLLHVRWITIAVLALLISCKSKEDNSPVIGHAFVGPATVSLRKELSLRSPTVAVLKHGDEVDIIQVRRRFVRLRLPSGVEGWTDSRQLLSTGQMQEFRQLAGEAARLPAQGWATVFDPLNIHTEPSRWAPTIFQIPENTSVAVIGHRVTQRIPPNNAPSLVPKPPPHKTKAKAAKKEKPKPRVPPPPMPEAPKPPENWLQLSYRTPEPAQPLSGDDAQPEAKPIPIDDWTLVRTKQGKIGWALTRPLVMGIPDDVAQYAEGHHITSYFPLGDVPDNGTVKHDWLWTTIKQLGQSYEFDGFRVFTWNATRHRYETAYRERDLMGYYPVVVQASELNEARKTVNAVRFSLVVRDEAGQFWRRNYLFVQNRVRFQGKEPIQYNQALAGNTVSAPAGEPSPAQTATKSWLDRLSGWKRKLWK